MAMLTFYAYPSYMTWRAERRRLRGEVAEGGEAVADAYGVVGVDATEEELHYHAGGTPYHPSMDQSKHTEVVSS